MGRRASPWSFRAGEWGHQSVTVFEREPGGVLYVRTKGKDGRYAPLSLRHRDKERAKAYALTEAARLAQGMEEIRIGKLTTARLFSLYSIHRTPKKTPREQSEDRRRVHLWTRFLSGEKDVSRITRGEMERFCDLRASGELSAQGEIISDLTKRDSVRARAVERDVQWLRFCLNWAVAWQDEEARFLLASNPLRGFHAPSENNPRRPIASTDRLEKILAAAESLEMQLRWGGKPVRQRCYLADLLTLEAETGRRITALRTLRWQDVVWDQAPHGGIRWPADTDKMGQEWSAPLSPKARAVLDRTRAERPGLGAAYVFPSPIDPNKPVSYERCRQWLIRAETKAKVPKQDGGSFHPYRRAWATARKHLPVTDVAAAGGWKSTDVLMRCYQQPDDATLLAVVLGGAELRERKA